MELNLSDMLFAAVNFLIMAFLLTKLLYKPVAGILEQRREQVKELQNQALVLQKEAENSFMKSEAEIAAAGKKAQEIINQAVKAGEESKAAIIEEAKESAASLLKKARLEIENEKERMKAELRSEVAALSVMAAGKLLNRELTQKDHDALIQGFISEYKAQKETKTFIYMGPEPMEVEVYTAVELSEKQMKALEKNLSESMEKIVQLKVIENKDLIGGLVLKIGDTIFDGSVANKMLQMQEQLLQA